MKSIPIVSAAFLTVFAFAGQPARAMISIKTLTKEQASVDFGIAMHAAKNGDAGVKVWIKFDEDKLSNKFAYAELKMEDGNGDHLLSAQLSPNPANHRRFENATVFAFSAAPNQLKRCSFFVVCSDGIRGHFGYRLPVKDFLDLSKSDLMSSLDGRWKQTAYIPNGTTVEDAGWYWEFDLSEGRYRVFGSPTSQAAANAGTLRVDSEVKPATITLSPLIANGPTQGIFKIEGEVLVIALAEDVPSDFEPSDGKHIYRFELQKKSD